MNIAQQILLIFCLLSPGCLLARETISASLSIFNEKNGLNSSIISGILRDDDGYFWLATENDIVRFDGANFIELKPASRYFAATTVKKIRRYGKWLFIAYENNGLVRMNLNDYSTQLITRESLVDFTLKSSNEIYWITKSGKICRFSDEKITRSIKINANLGQIEFYNNKILIKSRDDQKIYLFEPFNLELYKVTSIPSAANDEIFETGKNKLFYLKNKVLFEFDHAFNPVRIHPFHDTARTSITRYRYINDRLQFYLLNRKDLWVCKDGFHQCIPLPGLMNYELSELFINDQENILLGTNQGLIHIRLNPIKNSIIDDNIPENESQIRVRRKVLETDDGTLILTGFPYSFTYTKDSVFRKFTGSIFSTYDAVVVGDLVYAATEGDGLKLINLKNGNCTNDTTYPLKRFDTYTSIIKTNPDSVLYIGCTGRILRYELQLKSIKEIKLPNPNASVMAITYDPKRSVIWIGTNQGLFAYLENKKAIRSFRPDRSSASWNISDLLIRKGQRELWVGHDSGVDILDLENGALIKTLPAYLFSNPRICSLLEDNQSRVWMSTFSGITGYDPLKDEFLQINRKNGLLNREYNYKSAITRRNGNLVFGGLNGYDIIVPENYDFRSKNSNGIITGYHRITYEDTLFVKLSLTDPGPVNFYTDVEYLRFYLASSDIMNNSRYSFEYNLNDAPWLKVKGQPYINIVNLEPGRYELNVRAFDEYGAPVEFPPVRILSIVPLYRSAVFFVSLLILSIFLLILFITTALRLRKKEELLKEQISMDLHDEVGTILTRALHVSKNTTDNSGIKQLQNYLDEALYSLRVYIHSMNRRSFTMQELNDEIKDMLSVTFGSEKILLRFLIEEESDYKIKGAMFRDIKLCLYEMINNAFKHANGDSVEITLSMKDSTLNLLFTDNGKLNSLEVIEKRGNGIANLRKRVERNKGNIHFSIGQPNGGLEIVIEFPLKK